MENNYEECLRQFCIGLKMENIDNLMTRSPEVFKEIGENMAKRSNDRFSEELIELLHKASELIKKERSEL
ncbi:MAG: hypothetical protein HGB12_02985 [Bacteroidetes bacterium]|nr:hypothetical protein [Bacteroidota bacterium]